MIWPPGSVTSFAWQAPCMPSGMAAFHLQCVVHRGCVSGIALDAQRIEARTEAEAVREAEDRFTQLLGMRSGLASLKDDAGRVVWSSRRPVEPHASAEAQEAEG